MFIRKRLHSPIKKQLPSFMITAAILPEAISHHRKYQGNYVSHHPVYTQ